MCRRSGLAGSSFAGFLMLLVLSVQHRTPILADDDQEASAGSDAIREYEESVEQFNKGIVQHFDRLEQNARRRGDLSSIKQVQQEREDFLSSGSVPEHAPRRVVSNLDAALRTLRSVTEREVRDLVREGKDKEATELSERVEKVVKKLRLAGRGDERTIEIPADNHIGLDVGVVRKGDRLVLKYVDGRWSDKPGFPPISPDATEAGLERLPLRISQLTPDGVKKVLDVPGNTQASPFVWVAPDNYAHVFLVIADRDNASRGNSASPPVRYVFRHDQPGYTQEILSPARDLLKAGVVVKGDVTRVAGANDGPKDIKHELRVLEVTKEGFTGEVSCNGFGRGRASAVGLFTPNGFVLVEKDEWKDRTVSEWVLEKDSLRQKSATIWGSGAWRTEVGSAKVE